MNENRKKEQTSLLHAGHQGLTKQSENLVRRALNHLSKLEPRIVSFPKDWSFGTLYTVDDGKEIWERDNWVKVGKAIGDVTVLPRRKLILKVENREHERAITVCKDNYCYYFHSGEDCVSDHFVDLSPLATLKPDDLQGLELGYDLNWLPARNGMPEGFELIERLIGLEWLHISGTPVDNLLFLENLTQLCGLEIFGTNICRLTAIDKLTNLRYLSLEVTEFFDLEYFEESVNLEILHLHLNEELVELTGWHPCFFVDIECLKSLTNLRLLNLRGLDIGGSIEAIREELGLPECEIWI